MAAGAVKHDYHLVEPSPWPFIGSAAALVLAFGAVVWMKGFVSAPIDVIAPFFESPDAARAAAASGMDGLREALMSAAALADLSAAERQARVSELVSEYRSGVMPHFFFGYRQPWIMLLGFLGVIYTMIGWWADVVKESRRGDHTPVVQFGLRYGMILFIASEVMFFVAWFWIWFEQWIFSGVRLPDVAIGWSTWPPEGSALFDPFHLPLLNTLILLTSGTTVTWAHHALQHNKRGEAKLGLFLTILLGLCFTAVQIYEYTHAKISFSGDVFGASFYMATGFHGAHVVIGTIFLIVCWLRLMAGQFTPEKHFGFEAAAWYWHFVDVVWLFLFAFIYVVPYFHSFSPG